MLRGHPQEKQTMPEPTKGLVEKKPEAPQAPIEEIDEATEVLLRAKQEYLENKRYTTLEDDFELERLKDPTTRLHASRITELAFKEDKTELEKYELELYENVKTRPYAFRIMDLKTKENCTKLEALELRYLANEILRPYAKQTIGLIDKNYFDRTPKEHRILNLLTNINTMKNANEIADLETLNNLDDSQVRSLSIDYLTKIAEVPCYSTNDFHKNYRSPSFNPASDCIIRDNRSDNYDREVAKFRAIEDAFNNAAKKLLDSYMRQVFRKMNNSSLLASQSLFESKFKENSKISSIFQKRLEALVLILQKVYFDNNISFSQKSLDGITDYLNNLIMEQKLALNTTQHKDLEKLILRALMDFTAPKPEPVRRHGW